MAKTSVSDNPAGFDLYRSNDEFPAPTVAFFVPSRVREQIEAEREEQQKLAEAGLAAVPEPGKQNSVPGIAAKQPGFRPEHLDPEREEGELAVPVAGVDYDPAERHCVYDAGEPLNLLRNRKLATADRERHAQIEELYRKLKARGCLRAIAKPARGLESMQELEQSQPHFKAVISMVRDRLVLAQRVRRPLTIAPILLLGEPGVGKTHFAKALAQTLGSSIRQFAFDSDVSNAALLGSDKKWGNSTCGALFELIVLGDHANPVVVIDELDKCQIRQHNDPTAALHGLLEPTTAKRVTDISLGFSFDVSLVVWIATANDPLRIPQTLRSRFRQFHIDFPTPAQAIEIAGAVARATVRSLAPAEFKAPDRAVAVWLAHLTPREVQHAVADAVARAVTNGRGDLRRSDFPPEVLLDHDTKAGVRGWLH